MLEDGISLTEAIEIVTSSLDDEPSSSSSPIALVPQNETGFDPKIFDETVHNEIISELLRMGGLAGLSTVDDPITIGIFQQFDANCQAKSVLTVECSSPVWAGFVLAVCFVISGIPLAGVPLETLLDTVAAVPYYGKRYGINFGPFPFTPT